MKNKDRLSVEEISRIAELAKLDFSDGEMKRIREDFGEMLLLADELLALGDIHDCGATRQAVSLSELREDSVVSGTPREELLDSAESVHGGFIAVPRVVGEGESL